MMREPRRVEQRALDVLVVGAERFVLQGGIERDDTLTGAEQDEVTRIVRQLTNAIRAYGPVLLQLAQPPHGSVVKSDGA